MLELANYETAYSLTCFDFIIYTGCNIERAVLICMISKKTTHFDCSHDHL